jgi:hypothetical protein
MVYYFLLAFSDIGCKWEAIPIAKAISIIFLIIYCPSNVGTIKPDHVVLVKKTSGNAVVIIWKNITGMTTLSAFGIKNNIPISTSKNPKRIINVSKGIMFNVSSNKDFTKGVAGERERTFSIPNQKNTRNKPNLASGKNIL